jgi:hypothetical protein
MNNMNNMSNINIINFNGKKYMVKRLYDLVVSFPIPNNKKEEYLPTDIFFPYNNILKIIKSNLINRNYNKTEKAILLLRKNQIIELKENIDEGYYNIPKGIYKVIDGEAFFKLHYKYIIKNINNNNQFKLVISARNDINLRNIYVYIPIEKDNALTKFVKKISLNYNSVNIIQKLWENRDNNGDYSFFGYKSHSNILILNCEFISAQLRFPTKKYKLNLNDLSNNLKNNNNNNLNDASYLLLYLLYFNNLINYDKKINEEILIKALFIGEYIALDEELIKYIKKILTEFFSIVLINSENSEN